MWYQGTINTPHYCVILFLQQQNRQESCAIAKMTVQCALYTGALKIFSSSSSPSPDPNRDRIPKLNVDASRLQM